MLCQRPLGREGRTPPSRLPSDHSMKGDDSSWQRRSGKRRIAIHRSSTDSLLMSRPTSQLPSLALRARSLSRSFRGELAVGFYLRPLAPCGDQEPSMT